MKNVNTSVNTAQSGIEKIIEIMSKDMVYIPKAVMRCDDVYEESKMMFSVLFTNCLTERWRHFLNFGQMRDFSKDRWKVWMEIKRKKRKYGSTTMFNLLNRGKSRPKKLTR